MLLRSFFFFGLEKKNGQSRFIHCLKDANGQELSEASDVRRRIVEFYEELYKSEYVEDRQLCDDFLSDLPQVEETDKVKLVAQFTEEELYEALQSMDNRRAPGIDGLTVGFYKAYWGIIGSDFLEVVCDSILKEKLPLSCRRAVLTLLPKKGDLKEIKIGDQISFMC